LEHRALLYESDEEFLAAAIPFFDEGITQSHGLLAVTTETQIGLLREALDDRSARVEFADSLQWYDSPDAAYQRYRAYVKQKFEDGATWIRIVGEPVWAGRSESEIAAWTRYESIINVGFAPAPATILCPYDTRTLPLEVTAAARQTHPETAHGIVATASATYRQPEAFLLDPQGT
jgi:hypothetical protein